MTARTDEGPVEILLVEDTPSDARLAMRALKRGRPADRIQLATDGAKALDFVFFTGDFAHRSRSNLPKVSGIEVLRRLKGDPGTRSIPVVVMTSSRAARDLEDCYRLGVNSYIVKPVDFHEFTEAVTEIGNYWLLLNRTPN